MTTCNPPEQLFKGKTTLTGHGERRHQFQELVEEIESGALRYGASTFWPRMERRLRRLALGFPNDLMAYLWALYGHKSGRSSFEDTVLKLEAICRLPRHSKLAEIHALKLLSVLTFKRIPTKENFQYRKRAIILAHNSGDLLMELVLETNRIFALISLDKQNEAASALKRLEARITRLPPKYANKKIVRIINARLLGHKAKVDLRMAGRKRDYEAFSRGNEFYRQAIQAVEQIEHHRVNLLIEWANRLGDLIVATNHPALIKEATEKLAVANRGLDSHDCIPCEAYFFFVKALLCYLEGNLRYASNRERALESWDEAIKCAESSIKSYQKMGHHLAGEAEFMKKAAVRKITITKRPSKVFLSHKTADKPLVKRFEQILQQLGFEPWLDEHSLPPGTALTRKIQEGMRASCACVFFVTKSFKDEKYLGFEIELAKAVQIERGTEMFAIIPVVFGDSVDVPQMIKDLGKYVVTENELHALSEILRWLPIKLGSTYFPELLKEDWKKIR